MKQYLTFLILCVLALCGCEESAIDPDFQFSTTDREAQIRYSHRCRLNFEGGCPVFDGEGTRASALQWEDGAVIYVHFAEGVYGQGTYERQDGVWTFAYSGNLAALTDQACRVHYFPDATADNGSGVIALSAECAVYADAEAKFAYNAARDKLSLTAYLRPQVWRMRFEDMQAEDAVEIMADDNLLYPAEYDPRTGEVAYSTGQQSVRYGTDGSSTCIHALPVDASISLTLQTVEHQFERQLDGRNIHAGSSGRLRLPHAVLHDGWTMTNLEAYNMHNGHEYVDLGLTTEDGYPIYWATCNVGASKPEDAGLYFAWGETQGYGSDTSDGRSFDWESYKLYNGDDNSLTKYCTDSNYGIIDNKTVLDLVDDAAHANWGGSWCMPTIDEQKALIINCTWTWDSGKKGYTGKGPNGRTIFLPAAGCRDDSGLSDVGSHGYYWSSSLRTDYTYIAYGFCFDSGVMGSTYSGRYSGFSVRAVCIFTDSYLTISTTDINVGYTETSETFVITSNDSWTVTSLDSWITVSPTSGHGEQTVAVSVSQNSTTSKRKGSVVVQSANSGSQTITVSQEGMQQPNEGNMHNGHEYVDLGLTTNDGKSIYWATCNVGASKPEDAGLYFAWGETQGYGSDTNDGREFDWASYKWEKAGYDDWMYLTKYTCDDGWKEGIWYDSNGKFIGDGKKVLDLADDAAHANWGGSWRMPTYDELNVLKIKCTWTWDSSKKGYTVEGPNGNSIFLPAAGLRLNSSLFSVGSYGGFWSSSLYAGSSDYAYYLYFDSGSLDWYSQLRCYGRSVRAVCVSP